MASDPRTIEEVLAWTTTGRMGLSEQIAQLAEQLRQVQSASQAAEASLASSRASASRPSGGGSLDGLGNTLLDVFGAGLGLSPLISGIASLLGAGGGNSTSIPVARFALPPSIQASGGVSEGGGPAFAVDNPQGGISRPEPAGGPAGAATQITVQVQAMDSQSFLDHSADIAMAVRQAMLQSSVLNDVVREA